jgi:PKD repeat protein
VSNAAGTDTKTKMNYITVRTVPPKMLADFSASPTSGNVPMKVAFTDNSTGSPISWRWNFGDGTYSTEKNPAHTYSKAGKYAVSLTVRNATSSNTTTKLSYINVGTPLKAPVASFSASPTSGYVPVKVVFTDRSTNSPASWKWSFGDGNTSTQQNPEYTYSKAGRYTVSLVVRNSAGSNTATKSSYINVLTPLKVPVAAFSASPISGKAPLKVQFTDRSTESPASWRWNFGDGTYSTVKNPSHTYSKAGKYTVTLTATNARGSNTKTVSGYITVSR